MTNHILAARVLIGAALLFALAGVCSLTQSKESLVAIHATLEDKRPPRFEVTDLGLPPHATTTDGNAINDKGQIIGSSFKPGISINLIFLWENGRMQDIGTLPDKAVSFPGGINHAGHVIGNASNGGDRPFDPSVAFLYRNAKFEVLLPDKRDNTALGINDHDEVVGLMSVRLGVDHAFLWRNGRVTDLGTLQGKSSSACAINQQGQIVGCSDLGRNASRAVLWKNGKIRDLGTLGGQSSEARSINDKDHIVGSAETAQKQYHAFLWENGTMHDLGSPGPGLCTAAAINNADQIVGYCWSNDMSSSRALYWEDGKLYDLNKLIPHEAGWVLEWATGINAQGQIVGSGKHHGNNRAFLLTPVRQSSTLI